MNDHRGGPLGGPNDWSAGFLPASYQGTLFRAVGDPIVDLKRPETMTADEQRSRLDTLAKLNQIDMEKYPSSSDLAARISSYELAYRMQGCAPEAVDVSSESAATQKLYGLDEEVTRDFGWQCLLARRLVERGVRFVQCTHSYKWDQHSDLFEKHSQNAKEVDKPIAGLLRDLKARGLLRDTLVIWAGEFGRTPVSEKGNGRDHNPYGYSIWMAGGGVKPGFIYGATDEIGYYAVEDRMHIHDFHATVLHLLGLDHEKLTFRFSGRDFRLTDVAGVVAKKIIT